MERMLQCGEHEEVPGVLVCVHLLRGWCREWIELTDEDEELSDWVCPVCKRVLDQCDGAPPIEWGIENLRPVCIYCLEEARQLLDPNYQET